MNDHLVRILSSDGTLRAAAALTTVLVEETRRRQQTDPTATVALGRLVTGAALLGSTLKGAQRLALSVEGNGPLKRLSAETDAHGAVRATLKVPIAGLPPKDDRFDVAGAVGRAGFLHVIKDLGLRDPYHGTVQLVSSEIAEDLAWYLTTSEQIPSSVALGVALDREAQVRTAGGFLVQAMPGCPEGTLETLESRIRTLPPVTEVLGRGEAPEALLDDLFFGIPYSVQGRLDLAYRCTCGRQQVGGVLRALGAAELQRLADEQETTTVTCEFCKEVYAFTRDQVRGLAGG